MSLFLVILGFQFAILLGSDLALAVSVFAIIPFYSGMFNYIRSCHAVSLYRHCRAKELYECDTKIASKTWFGMFAGFVPFMLLLYLMSQSGCTSIMDYVKESSWFEGIVVFVSMVPCLICGFYASENIDAYMPKPTK